jgi:hypothetical protein
VPSFDLLKIRAYAPYDGFVLVANEFHLGTTVEVASPQPIRISAEATIPCALAAGHSDAQIAPGSAQIIQRRLD